MRVVELVGLRGDKEIEKLLRNIEEKPENAGEILGIAREKSWDYKWIAKTIFHHRNFSSPEKCRIMEELAYNIIMIGLSKHVTDAALYTAAVCMTPIEGKEKSRIGYKKLTPETMGMHEERRRVLEKVYERVEMNADTQMFLRRVKKGMRQRCRALGIETPERFEIKRTNAA
ncbi:hypothetical protein H0O02_03985 [Candidatus Micrarchaeota archaeon]|nr:hypothetical protein [Candidatus Micrarchaeota archaeon]